MSSTFQTCFMMTLIRLWGQTFSHKVSPINEVYCTVECRMNWKCIHTLFLSIEQLPCGLLELKCMDTQLYKVHLYVNLYNWLIEFKYVLYDKLKLVQNTIQVKRVWMEQAFKKKKRSNFNYNCLSCNIHCRLINLCPFIK